MMKNSPEYGDNEPILEPGDNELTGSEANTKTQPEIKVELGIKEHELPYWSKK